MATAMNGYAGEVCKTTGDYTSECEHNLRIKLNEGETFPACQSCNDRTYWRLVDTPKA